MWDTPSLMGGLRVGYARVSTDEQDLTAQHEALAGLGVAPERIYADHGLTGTTRRPRRGYAKRSHPVTTETPSS